MGVDKFKSGDLVISKVDQILSGQGEERYLGPAIFQLYGEEFSNYGRKWFMGTLRYPYYLQGRYTLHFETTVLSNWVERFYSHQLIIKDE